MFQLNTGKGKYDRMKVEAERLYINRQQPMTTGNEDIIIGIHVMYLEEIWQEDRRVLQTLKIVTNHYILPSLRPCNTLISTECSQFFGVLYNIVTSQLYVSATGITQPVS